MMDQERTHARNRRITRRVVAVALLAATAATGAVFLIKQDARGASAAAAGGGTDAIIGGEDAPNDQFPWIVNLQSTDEESDDAGQFCGGSLISPDTVLSAAHCFVDEHTGEVPTDLSIYEAVIGAYNDSRVDAGGVVGWTPERRKIASLVIHPDYDPDPLFNDLSIVKLATPSTLPPVKLADTTPAVGTKLMVIGWGDTIQKNITGSSYSYSYSYDYVCDDVQCPDGSAATCCDADADADGKESCENYCCGDEYLCSNDSRLFAASLGGELCCDVGTSQEDETTMTDEVDDFPPKSWGSFQGACHSSDSSSDCIDGASIGVSSSSECWNACKAAYLNELVAIDYRPSDGLCCCETECSCLDQASPSESAPFDVMTIEGISELGWCSYSPAVLQFTEVTVEEPTANGCSDKPGGLPVNLGYEICAGGINGRDVCFGDSGGPLFEKQGETYTLVGTVSGGDDCGYTPSTFQDVAAYRDWIDKEAASCVDDASWHKTDEPEKDCAWVARKPDTRCAVKGPGWGQDRLMASYACKSVCGGPCEDSGSWHKNGEDWKGCAWVSIFPEKRCSVRGEDKVLAATACPDSCA